MTSAEAANAMRVRHHLFNSWWNETRKGWDIPVGDVTTFVPSIGSSPHKRRVPRALLEEIASYGRIAQ